MKTSYTENLEVKYAPQEPFAEFFRIRLRIGVFYGKTFPLFVTAFRDVLSLPSTAKLQIFYSLFERAQPPMTTMSQQPPSPQPPKKPLLEQMRDALRVRHYSIRTETSYLDWVKRFILFHDKRHPAKISLFVRESCITGSSCSSRSSRSSCPNRSSRSRRFNDP